MIYDCVTFYNEIDLLLLRLNILKDKVHRFVIVEASKTHSGLDKEFLIQKNWEKLASFHDKITYIKIEKFPERASSWTYENYQRNVILEGLKNCLDDDVILISDLDEIPNPLLLPQEVPDGKVFCFLQEMYFYYANNFNSKHIIWEGGTKATSYRTIKDQLLNEKYVKFNNVSFPSHLNSGVTPTKIRLYRNLTYIVNGGWHLSYIGGVESIMAKLNATSHQEINKKQINNEEHIKNCLMKGVDLLDPNKRCFMRPKKRFPDILKDGLPNTYFLVEGSQMLSFKYVFLKWMEITSIYFRNFARKIFG